MSKANQRAKDQSRAEHEGTARCPDPADLKPLRQYAGPIRQAIRTQHAKRGTDSYHTLPKMNG